MYVNPYAPVNPAMMGVTQQRLNNYQAQMPQVPAYQQQQFVPQPPMPLMMKGRTVASLDEVKAAQIDLDGSLTYFPCPADNCIYAKAININGYPVKGANVEITISSGHTENGKTNNDGRYLLSWAGYQEIKNANISSGDMPKVMDVKVSSNEGSDVLTLYNLEELQENKIYDLEIHIV